MSKTIGLLDSLGAAEDGVSPLYPDGFVGDIRSAYDEDMGLSNAAVEVARAELAEAQAEIAILKAHNYDLLMAAPSAPGAAVEGEDDGESDDDEPDEDDDGEKTGVNRIFSKKDED